MTSSNFKNNRKSFYSLIFPFIISIFSCCKSGTLPFLPKENREPTAYFTYENVSGSLRVDFDASGSYDNDLDDNGKIIKYEWDFGDKRKEEGINIFHIYEMPGLYLVKLTVTDDDDDSNSTVEEVTVTLRNERPKAILEINGTEENLDFVWEFDGSESFDFDGFIKRYLFKIIRRSDENLIKMWDGKKNSYKHIFSKRDLLGKKRMKFIIILEVWDNQNASDTDPKVIEVTELL